MLFEHERGRECVAGMAEALAGTESGDKEAPERFALFAEQYVELLRGHIHKEDMILFPLADRVMSDSDREVLLSQFEVVEKEHMGLGTHEKYLKLAASLAATYGVDAQAIEKITAGGSCGCSHHNH